MTGGFKIDSYNEFSFQLLAWIYVSDEDQDGIYSPEHSILHLIGLNAAVFFLKVLDDTPINDDLLDMFYGEETENNLYRQRDILKWIQQDSYLSRFKGMPDRIETTQKSYGNLFNSNADFLRYTAIVNFVFTEKCGPLALLPKDWYATMLNNYEELRTSTLLTANLPTISSRTGC